MMKPISLQPRPFPATLPFLAGHQHDPENLTGVTVFLFPDGAVGGVDVRGGASGSRELDCLSTGHVVERIHGVAFCGGSAYGLAAVDGILVHLRARGIGFPIANGVVPIVPAAVIFDLAIGAAPTYPDRQSGIDACDAALSSALPSGCCGVGSGATVGKLLSPSTAMKSGFGQAYFEDGEGFWLGAAVVVNALGNVIEPVSGQVLAGARDSNGLPLPARWWEANLPLRSNGFGGGNTTLALVLTNAGLDRVQLQRLAARGQDGMVRTIRPIHTQYDGDIAFAVSLGNRKRHPVLLGELAAEAVQYAILDAVRSAHSAGGLPAARDLVERR